MFLMTCHGTLLACAADGAVLHHPPGSLPPGAALLELDLPAEGEPGRFARCMAAAADAAVLPAHGRDGTAFEAHLQPDRRTLALRRDGLFLSALPGQALVEPCRAEAAGWELFLPLTAGDLSDLSFLLAGRWALATTSTLLAHGDVRLEGREYRLLLGEGVAIDLRHNLPLAARERGPDGEPMVADVLLDGWRVERLHLYRPMVFVTAFRAPEYLSQAQLCLSSLLEFGRYDGAIHVISDHGADTFRAFLPALPAERLSVREVRAADWVGYVASKYFILDDPAARGFQPLLFLDPDVMADADLAPMLVSILTSPRMMAPMEVFSGLSTSPSVGATLVQRAGLSPRFACGFNGGTIGIPNLSAHAHTLRLIRTIIVNFLELHGRDSFQWVDQEVANYVSLAGEAVDTATLLRFVRWGWEGCEEDATRRQGLVHFFPARGGMPKSEAMRRYTHTLRTAARP